MERPSVEKRKHLRFAVRLPISFSGSGVREEGIVSSLSEAGCAGESKASLHRGACVKLRILMPDHFSPMAVDLARVRWVLGRRFGLEFLRMRPEERVRLGRIVKCSPL